MDLFPETIDSNKNWLPYHGEVYYWGNIFTMQQSDVFFNELMHSLEWKNDEAIIYGKHIITKRKVAWYADQPYEYTYSKIHRKALVWNSILKELKVLVEKKTGVTYNSCLLNLYHNGEEGMSWHSDDEKDLLSNGSIASLSFGATRKFVVKHRETKYQQAFMLNHGDLLEMRGEMQQHWVHRVATTKKVKTPRINLTFRQMIK
ncbi:alpha-ketoglutarate-dependent dioxygenase AlkB [bacterium SCSIO 12643]|nr:alpha-ketoglutarate-dependent dioxygenase AlkB [bacterium SCSIO 12643]